MYSHVIIYGYVLSCSVIYFLYYPQSFVVMVMNVVYQLILDCFFINHNLIIVMLKNNICTQQVESCDHLIMISVHMYAHTYVCITQISTVRQKGLLLYAVFTSLTTFRWTIPVINIVLFMMEHQMIKQRGVLLEVT